MATQTFNTRVQLKIDSFDNWKTNDPVLLKGEIGIVDVPVAQGSVSQVPAILMKVGDGTKHFMELSWTSALAADVFPWAKAATKPAYSADEITGLSDYISGQIQDADTQYRIVAAGADGIQLQSKPKVGGEWSNVGTPIKITYTLEEGAANGTVKFNGVDVKVHGLGSAAYADTTAFDPAGAADAKDAAIAEAKKAGTDAQAGVNTLVGTDTGKSVRTSANEELAAQLIPEGAQEALDTLAEIAAWIQQHPDDASAMNAKIAAVELQLTGIDAGSGTVKKYIDGAIAALKLGDYAKAADLTAAVKRIDTLEGKAHTHNNKDVLDGITTQKVTAWDAAEGNAKKYTDTLEGKLKAVAKSGDIKDLTQTEGDYIIFNCGTSSTVI